MCVLRTSCRQFVTYLNSVIELYCVFSVKSCQKRLSATDVLMFDGCSFKKQLTTDSAHLLLRAKLIEQCDQLTLGRTVIRTNWRVDEQNQASSLVCTVACDRGFNCEAQSGQRGPESDPATDGAHCARFIIWTNRAPLSWWSAECMRFMDF